MENLPPSNTARKNHNMVRRRSSAFDDLMTVAAKLPWKVSVSLALIAFAILHLVAQLFSPITQAPDVAALGAVVVRQYVHVFAAPLQFIVPAGLLFGAIVSFIKQKRSIELIYSVRSPAGREVSSLTWQEFERLTGEGFR